MSDEPAKPKPQIEVDQITLVCRCGRERVFYPDRPLRGAQELIEWLTSKVGRCICGAETCDVKARIKNAADLETKG